MGLGNSLYSDEGFGPHAVEELQNHPLVPPNIDIIDGGTQGVYLLPRIEVVDRLLIIDAAIPIDGPPKVKVYHNSEIKALLQPALSAHQSGVHTLMAMATLHKQLPEEVALIAVPAVLLEMSTELSPEIQALMPEVLEKALEILGEWGA